MKYCKFLLFCHIFINFYHFNVMNIFCECQPDSLYHDDDESERIFEKLRILKKADPTYETTPHAVPVLNQSYHEAEEEEDRSDSGEENRDIIIYNFDPDINDNLDIVKKVYDLILRDYLGIHVTYKEIEAVTKIGSDPTWKRPVIITFKTYEFKKEVLRKRQFLRCGSYKVESFIPREVMLEQQKFVPEAKRLRKEGRRVHLRDGKFIVDGVIKRNFNREYRERLRRQALINKHARSIGGSNFISTNDTVSIGNNNGTYLNRDSISFTH